MKKTILLLSLVSILTCPGFADTIYFKDGSKKEVEIIEKTDKYIKIDFYGVTVTYWLDEIERIEEDGSSLELEDETAALMEKSPAQIFKQAAPAIVYITTRDINQQRSQASGFIVGTNGIILTAYHVISQAKEVNIRLKDGKNFPVSAIVDYDRINDICVLKIDASDLPTIDLADSNQIEIGQKILVISNPLGLEYTISDGLLSAVRDYQMNKLLQISAPVSPGSSGGPVLDMNGRALGIVTSRVGSQNLNFAVPMNEAIPLFHSYVKMTFAKFVKQISPADAFFNEARSAFYEEGNFQKAIEYLKRSINLDSGFTEAFILLSLIYGLRSDIDNITKGIEYGEQAIRLNSDTALYYLLVGLWYGKRGSMYKRESDLEKAIEYFNKALSLYPNSAKIYGSLGLAYLEKGEFDMAIGYYEKALSINSNEAVAYEGLGKIFKLKGQLDRAISYFKRAISIDPMNSLAYSYLCEIYIQKGDRNSALRQVERLEEINTRDSIALAATLRKVYKFDKLSVSEIPDKVRYSLQDNQVDTLIQTGDEAFVRKNYVLAIEYYKKALLNIPRASGSYIRVIERLIITYERIGLDYFSRKLFDDSLKYFKEEISLLDSLNNLEREHLLDLEKHLNCYFYLGLMYTLEGNRDEAYGLIKKMRSLNQNDFVEGLEEVLDLPIGLIKKHINQLAEYLRQTTRQ